MAIPIQNIYYLLCYAWDRFEAGQSIPVDNIASTRLVDLLATVLIQGTRRILKRGLDRSYKTYSEATSRLRGRIEMGATVRHMLHKQAKAYCTYDELSHDVLHNAILKWSLYRLAQTEGIDKSLRKDLLVLHKHFAAVSDIRLTRHHFGYVMLHRNNGHYQFLMHVCELIFQSALLDESTGQYRFNDFLQDENKMAALFERFLLNFYSREQTIYKVGSKELRWNVTHADDQSLSLLPRMMTDVTLEHPGHTIVIDAKYYRASTVEYYGNERFRSAHIYQMFAYLQNLPRPKRPGRKTTGILLYPKVGRRLDHAVHMHGHEIRFFTIDLDQEWRGIHRDLLSLIPA